MKIVQSEAGKAFDDLMLLRELDTQGRVVQKHEGLRDPALYETEIRALLGLPIDARVETFEDTGQIFLAHADRASELPGVDFSKLTPQQKQAALHKFNAESCNCGCNYPSQNTVRSPGTPACRGA